jgi:acid phosphatase
MGMGSLRRAGAACAAAGVALFSAVPASAAPPTFRHVVVVMLENRSYANVAGSRNAPYVNGTLMPRYATGTQLYVTTHNSPAAYFMLSAGKRYEKGDGGWWAGTCGTATAKCSTSDDSVFSQIGAAGKSWRVYSEDQTTPCQLSIVKKYWPNHNPAIFFRRLGPNGYSSSGDGTCRRWDVPFANLATDLAGPGLPDFAFIIPHACENMHD